MCNAQFMQHSRKTDVGHGRCQFRPYYQYSIVMNVDEQGYYQIKSVENLERKIILNNDTEWEIYFLDAIKSALWLPSNRVTVRNKNEIDSWKVLTNAIYPYTTIIENINSGKMVGAKQLK